MNSPLASKFIKATVRRSRNMRPKILVHGGVGDWSTEESRRALVEEQLSKSVEAGLESLSRGSAMDGVVEAVAYMEDSGVFNCGKGSYLTLDGRIEMDAGVMDGRSGKAGAVASVTNIPNPIRMARVVMEKTKHVLLAGTGAEKVADAFGLLGKVVPSPEREERYSKYLQDHLKKESWISALGAKYSLRLTSDTVGAVAIDSEGNVACAASTGGTPFKLPGRVGDTPIPRAGFFALNASGAACATGVGEAMVQYGLCGKIVDDFGCKAEPLPILKHHIRLIGNNYGKGLAGVIAINFHGMPTVFMDTLRIAAGFGAAGMAPRVGIFDRPGISRFNRTLSNLYRRPL